MRIWRNSGDSGLGAEQQQELMEDMAKNMRELSKQPRKENLVYSDKRRDRCAEEKNQKMKDLMSGIIHIRYDGRCSAAVC